MKYKIVMGFLASCLFFKSSLGPTAFLTEVVCFFRKMQLQKASFYGSLHEHTKRVD